MLKTKHISNHPNEYLKIFQEFDTNGGTLREYVQSIERLTKTIDFWGDDERNKFRGDSLEILSELFFNAFENDESIGINNYEPVPIDEDYGVDAFGINVNGDKCMIQVKFRGNPSDLVTYADIARTFTSGVIDFELDSSKNHTVYIFTNSNGVTQACKTVFKNRLVIISKEIIKTKIDNNKSFWKFAHEQIIKYLGERI